MILSFNINVLRDNVLMIKFKTFFAQSAGAVEYTDCTSAEG